MFACKQPCLQAIEQRIEIMAALADTGLESAYKAQAKAAAKVIRTVRFPYVLCSPM
jgi:hypothetical protein